VSSQSCCQPAAEAAAWPAVSRWRSRDGRCWWPPASNQDSQTSLAAKSPTAALLQRLSQQRKPSGSSSVEPTRSIGRPKTGEIAGQIAWPAQMALPARTLQGGVEVGKTKPIRGHRDATMELPVRSGRSRQPRRRLITDVCTQCEKRAWGPRAAPRRGRLSSQESEYSAQLEGLAPG